MFQVIIHRLLERRHFWRIADFSELSELYATRLLRALAVNMVSIFVLIYLLQNGYSLAFTLGYAAIYMVARALFVWPNAYLIAIIGPKHATLVSNLVYIPALISLSFLPEFGLPVLIGFGLLQAVSVSLYDISYAVNFSKIKHVDHTGKELSFMYMFEKIAAALSPLIGGAIATLFGAQWALYGAAFLFFIAASPLLFTPEQVSTHQRIRFRGINWHLIRRNLLSQVSVGVDAGASAGIWSLFLALIVFTGSGNVLYLEIGAVSSITILSALVVARIYGVLIDRHKSSQLLIMG
ncbi:MAG: MFS transporter, partial [Microcoleus sp.]